MLTFPPVPCVAYAEIREQICSGDILLCSGSAIFSKLIQHATGSVWSHVAFILRDQSLDRLMVLESVESIGVQTVPLSQYVRNYNQSGAPYKGRIYIARHRGFAAIDSTSVLQCSQAAVDLFGTKYDTQQIAAIAIRIGAAKIWISMGEPCKDKIFICSEFFDLFFSSLGLQAPYDPRGFISPADVAKWSEVAILWEIALKHL